MRFMLLQNYGGVIDAYLDGPPTVQTSAAHWVKA